MALFQRIKTPVEQELKAFDVFFKEILESEVPLLNTILKYVYSTKGKQIRPIFVFLSAKLFDGSDLSTQIAACSVELLHTATLIHDDVVDDSLERRGEFSVKALWKDKIAVLVGDYVLVRLLHMLIEHEQYRFLGFISRAAQDMIEGEMLQMKKARKPDTDFEAYYDVIFKKTASLIATCMAVGAASATQDKTLIDKMYDIGKNAGMAFQIKDDIFDYQMKGDLGKPTGKDIREKKVTLPLLYVLRNANESEKQRILKITQKNDKDSKEVDELIKLVNQCGGIDYATRKMNEFRDKAIVGLMDFPENEARNALVDLMNFITEREN